MRSSPRAYYDSFSGACSWITNLYYSLKGRFCWVSKDILAEAALFPNWPSSRCVLRLRSLVRGSETKLPFDSLEVFGNHCLETKFRYPKLFSIVKVGYFLLLVSCKESICLKQEKFCLSSELVSTAMILFATEEVVSTEACFRLSSAFVKTFSQFDTQASVLGLDVTYVSSTITNSKYRWSYNPSTYVFIKSTMGLFNWFDFRFS